MLPRGIRTRNPIQVNPRLLNRVLIAIIGLVTMMLLVAYVDVYTGGLLTDRR